jgi:hypothetical protein
MRQSLYGGDNLQAGDLLEVPYVERGHIKTQNEGGYADGQIFKRKRDSLRSLLAFDASYFLRDLDSSDVLKHRDTNPLRRPLVGGDRGRPSRDTLHGLIPQP